MIDHSLWEFTALEQFLKYYDPLTPFVSKNKNTFTLITDYKFLTELYADIEISLEILKIPSKEGFPASVNKFAQLSLFLKKLPELPWQSQFLLQSNFLGSTEIQAVKKFLIYTEKISHLMPESAKNHFALNFSSGELLALLKISDLESTDLDSADESFYLSEKYSDSLREVRTQIRALDTYIKKHKLDLFAQIEAHCGVDFKCQDFALRALDQLNFLNTELLVVEPYDQSQLIIKPRYPKELLELFVQREKHLGRERLEEAAILTQLNNKIQAEKAQLQNYQNILARIDMAFAKAKMAVKFNLSRPQLNHSDSDNHNDRDRDRDKISPAESQQSKTILIKNGRLLPLEQQCQQQESKYWPLNISFTNQANLVVGSNMGGKTVVLRTLAFLQLLAQTGFFVPAEFFSTSIFSNICYLGTGRNSVGLESAGLSSFGFEIKDFIKAWEKRSSPLLLLIDEFARTTNSREATALLNGMICQIAKEPQTIGIVSTHFVDLDLPKQNAQIFKMKGLAREAYEKYYAARANLGDVERIKWIQNFMQYEVCDNTEAVFDAINIAEILGFPSTIITEARKYKDGKSYV